MAKATSRRCHTPSLSARPAWGGGLVLGLPSPGSQRWEGQRRTMSSHPECVAPWDSPHLQEVKGAQQPGGTSVRAELGDVASPQMDMWQLSSRRLCSWVIAQVWHLLETTAASGAMRKHCRVFQKLLALHRYFLPNSSHSRQVRRFLKSCHFS